MSGKEWQAVWICDPEFSALEVRNVFYKECDKADMPEHKPELQDHHMLVRKEFDLGSVPSACFLDITADDFYRLYVNGEFVGEGPANSYAFRYRYDRRDITPLLRPGRNTIAVQVYYQGLINRVWVSGDYRQGMIAEIVDESGNVIVASDDTWKMLLPVRTSGRKIGYETQFVENIDSGSWPCAQWRESGYDDSGWGNACALQDDGHELVESEIPPLAFQTVKPEAITRLSGGGLLCDFGREMTGYFTCVASGKAGATVRIRHAEELSDGKVVVPMRCNCDYDETWTLSGQSEDRLEYTDYKAFRYVELQPDENVEVGDIAVLCRHYPLGEKVAQFKSDDSLLQGMWDICGRALTVSCQSGFLDCPSREKGQYLGDLTVSAHAHLYYSADKRLYKKAMQDFADSAFICPGLMAVAPAALMQEIADYSLQYPQQLWTYYRYTGDLETVRGLFPAAEKMMEYFSRYERADGLLQDVRDKWNLVDWPDNLRDGYDFRLDPGNPGEGPHAVLNAFYAAAKRMMNRLREVLGLEADVSVVNFKEAFLRAFYREDEKLFADSEVSGHTSLHSNVMALYAGLTPDEAVDDIADFIMEKGFSCGVYMSYFVLKALAGAKKPKYVYDLMTNRGEHSWANMLREGATSCFEAWGKDQKFNTSFCHPWASAPIPVMIEDWIGLYPAGPGFKTIGLRSTVNAGHPDFSLSLSLPVAKVYVEKAKDKLRFVITPDNCGCRIEVDDSSVKAIEFSDGKSVEDADGFMLPADTPTELTFLL